MKPHDVLTDCPDPKQQLLIMSQPTVKTEADSPATDALDFILQSEDPASLMLDLTDLLKRDPTLASLEDSSQGFSGMPIPKKSPDRPTQLNEVSLDLGGSSGHAISTGFGGFGPSGSSYGSAVTASPLASTSPSMWETTRATIAPSAAVKMETDPANYYVPPASVQPPPQQQPTLAQLNSAGALDENSLRLLGEVENLDSYFVTSDSGNVTLSGAGMDYSSDRPTVIKQETSVQPDDGLLFSTSFSNHTGGAVFGSKDLLSSSVPGSIFHNSPLSDILGDISSTASPSSVSPNHNQSPSHAGPERVSTLHKLLLKKDPVLRPSPVRSPESRKTLGKMRNSLSASNPLLSQQLSKSAPTHSSYLDRLMWSRREPRQHISSVCSVGGESSIADEVSDVLSGLSPNELPDIVSDDEEEGGEEQDAKGNDRMEQETSSDEDLSDNEEGTSPTNNKSGGSKKERYFWQYNVQAKGPKGQKIVVETKMEDPHVLNEIVDPVFSGDVQLQGIKHSGKARRGDGNDLTSNPKKLAAIGRELDQLNKVINDLTPVSEMPFTARCKSRKEKNKLASRACRLKKKAQHEANKLKIHGLEDEHKMLNQTLSRMRELLREKLDPNSRSSQEELTAEIENLMKKSLKFRVAGQTTEYVNRMIDRYNVSNS